MDSLERIHHNFVCVALQPDAMNVTLASVKLRGETHGFQWVEKLPPTVWDLETWDFGRRSQGFLGGKIDHWISLKNFTRHRMGSHLIPTFRVFRENAPFPFSVFFGRTCLIGRLEFQSDGMMLEA